MWEWMHGKVVFFKTFSKNFINIGVSTLYLRRRQVMFDTFVIWEGVSFQASSCKREQMRATHLTLPLLVISCLHPSSLYDPDTALVQTQSPFLSPSLLSVLMNCLMQTQLMFSLYSLLTLFRFLDSFIISFWQISFFTVRTFYISSDN